MEQEAREQAEYEKLKETFTIEGEGVGVKQLDDDAEEHFNCRFVETIQEAKIISLERLCIEFDMKTDVSSTFMGLFSRLSVSYLPVGAYVVDLKLQFLSVLPSVLGARRANYSGDIPC